MLLNRLKILQGSSFRSAFTPKFTNNNLYSASFTYRMVSAAAAGKSYVMAIDQGTTSSRVLLIDQNLKVVDTAQREHEQICLHPGWCEHDPMEIYNNVLACSKEVLERNSDAQVQAIGITNQRETTVAWDRKTG